MKLMTITTKFITKISKYQVNQGHIISTSFSDKTYQDDSKRLIQQILCSILIILRQQIKHRMSLQPRVKNIRVLSAKVTQPSVERSRPKSGIPNQTYTRRQMIETVYNSQGSDLYRIQSARQPATNIISQNFENDRSIKKVTKQSRQKQQMASQILGLKQTINRLVEQLSHQKGKNENMRKKSLKYEKILTMQFEDEKQWGSNAVNNHLVTGIKSMYDSLKEKYQAKCQELDNFIKKEQITKDLESQHYIAVLEGEIKNLKKKIEKSNELNLASAFTSQTQRQANQYVVADLQSEKVLLLQKSKELQKKVKMMNKNIEELQLKIQLDKKLITQKDNNLHAFERKNKELNREIQKVKQLNLLLDNQLKETRQKYQNQVVSYKEAVQESEQKYKREVDIISKGKQIRIQSLEYDNAYLHKMIQQLRSTNLELNKTNQELRQLNFKDTSNKGSEDRDLKKDNYASAKANKDEFKTVIGSNIMPYQNGKRIPQKADKKYHENAVKTRKIQLVEVLQIAELVRLKLIGQQYSIQKVKSLFDFKQQNKSKESIWEKQYITMVQVRRIFSHTPFNLDEEDAMTLSRYLIEDIQEDYVYCDQLNQNHREVVKSIIKTLIQEYPVYDNDSPQYYEVTDTIEKYGKNLRSALNTVIKGQIVSKAKLAEVMKSIGMEVRTSIFQLILSKMAVKSNKLSQLDFASII